MKAPIEQCWNQCGKVPIKTKCVDSNKGDEVNMDLMSGLWSQKKIKTNKRTDLFAAMPPAEARKILFSRAVTEGVTSSEGKREKQTKSDFVDISRTYFQADAIRDVYAQPLDKNAELWICGKLLKPTWE